MTAVMRSLLVLLSLLFSVPAFTQPDLPIRVDEQALPEFSLAEHELYIRALRVVMESPQAPKVMPTIFLTTRDSLWFTQVAESSGASVEDSAFSFTIRRKTSSGRPADSVVILWDRIQLQENPLPLLVTALARELIGSLKVLNIGARTPEGQMVDDAFVFHALLGFFRTLPDHPSYRWLPLTQRAELAEYREDVAVGYRDLRARAINAGICADLLTSEDN